VVEAKRLDTRAWVGKRQARHSNDRARAVRRDPGRRDRDGRACCRRHEDDPGRVVGAYVCRFERLVIDPKEEQEPPGVRQYLASCDGAEFAGFDLPDEVQRAPIESRPSRCLRELRLPTDA
jgi:hypothetical protein